MKISFHRTQYRMTHPLEEPAWSSQVNRWYQLDGPALALCQLFFEHKLDFNHLVLASPEGCNETDRDFAQTGAQRAQKFVHTLPNIRASMALQLREEPCPFICFMEGAKTLEKALKEFYALALENQRPALVSVYKLGPNEYEAWAATARN